MNLYLASLPILDRNRLEPLLNPGRGRQALVIANAWDTYPPERSQPIIEAHLAALRAVDVSPLLLDLTIATQNDIEAAISHSALIWVMGGNSFYLNHHLHASGLVELLKTQLESGLVYAGDSAGAAVAGPTLRGVQLLDDPAKAPGVIWDGLGLVPFGIVPHWGNPKYAAMLEQCRDEMATHCPVRTLSDQEIMTVAGAVVSVASGAPS